ncbi:MAG: endonuclease/exonuclease/phosphatase family protein [Bdellovibrionales bacterium]
MASGEAQDLSVLQKLSDSQFSNKYPNEWAQVVSTVSSPITVPSRSRQNQTIQGEKIRVLEYNILRNLQYDRLETLLTRCQDLPKHAKSTLDAQDLEQLCQLSKADILLLNEVDRGHCRSEYRDGAESLASAMGFHYSYAIEFLEVHAKSTGLEDGDGPLCRKGMVRADAKNQHGNAVLSRFPIVTSERIELTPCFDWFTNGGDQTRRGGRMALVTEIQLPEPHKSILAVSVHLENKTNPECRNQQMQTLLSAIERIETQKGRKMDVIIGGDMNTILASSGTMKDLWKKNLYDYGFNDGSTLMFMRLDYIVTKDSGAPQSKAFRAMSGVTANFVKEKLQTISDHTPIYVDVNLKP